MLQAQALAAFRAERLVFRDLTFAVPRAGALVVTGPNGVGKSTLLRLLAGLLGLAAGKLIWDGEDALTDPASHSLRLVYVGHQDAVKPGLTVAENLAFAVHVRGGRVAGALAALGLGELADMPARLLSAGQKRRLALAQLALAPVPLWLLDEPSNGLDETAMARLAGLFERHRAKGGIVIATSHRELPLPGAARLALG